MKTLTVLLGLFAGLISNTALAAEGPVRFAIVGLVHDHARGFIPSAKSRQDVQLVAIVEPNQDLARRYAETYEIDTNLFYTSLEEMLEGPGAGRGHIHQHVRSHESRRSLRRSRGACDDGEAAGGEHGARKSH